MIHSTIDTPELGDALNRYGPTAARSHQAMPGKVSSTTVDAHAHVHIAAATEFMIPHIDIMMIAMVKHSDDETRAVNRKQDEDRIPVAMTDLLDRIAVLDRQGIDKQLVSPPPQQCYYQSPVEHALKGSQLVNDGMAEWVSGAPDRFAGLGTVPLQDPEASAAELERAMRLGLKGVMLLTNVDGSEIGDDRFDPFWRKAEELGAFVMIHPNGFTEGARFQKYYFSNVLGNPLETTTALHYLVFNGVLERMPDLKIFAVHGGGFLPSYSGRIDHAWGARKDCRGRLKNPPTESLRRVYFDSVVFTNHQLEYLVGLFGADRILMGSDYPFDMADYDPVGHVVGSSLSDKDKLLVAGGNAERILGF
ncbi:MAG: amidohydrolase family protein [Albidovulum sp.]|nr:amidohydrolase family protein [Albidovulum sp.]